MLYAIRKFDSKEFKVWKYTVSPDDAINIWCNEWYGHHIVGQDCELIFKPLAETKIFYEIAPKNDKRCCANCKAFTPWGVSTGYCSENHTDNLASHNVCKRFDWESEERKREKML